MKIIRIQTQDREYNGTPFKYFNIYATQGEKRVIIGCPGSTPVQLVDEYGTYVSELYRLSQYSLKVGDLIEVWYQDGSQRVAQIDVLEESNLE